MTFWQNDVATQLNVTADVAEKVHALVCVSGLSFSNSSREQLNRAYQNAFDALRYLGKV